jgi:hypothetical protein
MCLLISSPLAIGVIGSAVLLMMSIGYSRLAFHGPVKRSGARPRVGQNWQPPSGYERTHVRRTQVVADDQIGHTSVKMGLTPKCLLDVFNPNSNSSARSSAVGTGFHGESAHVTPSLSRSRPSAPGLRMVRCIKLRSSVPLRVGPMASLRAMAITGWVGGRWRELKSTPRAAPEVIYPGRPLATAASGRATRECRNCSMRSWMVEGSSFTCFASAQYLGPLSEHSRRNQS